MNVSIERAARSRLRGSRPLRSVALRVAGLLVSCAAIGAPAAHADLLVWECELDESQVRNGPAHDGTTDSPGRASARLELDTETHELFVRVEWKDLVGSLRKLHIHGPASAARTNPRHVVELIGPPAPTPEQASTSGSFEARFPLTAVAHPGHRPLGPDEARRILESGSGYLNLHTSVFAAGEIRGNLGKPVRRDPTPGDGSRS